MPTNPHAHITIKVDAGELIAEFAKLREDQRQAEMRRLHRLALQLHGHVEAVAPLIGWTPQETADSLCASVPSYVLPDLDPDELREPL